MGAPLAIISAGRTRDLAGWQPTHLAEVLEGKAPARRGPRSPAFFIDLDQVGAVVLWTKQPAGLLDSPRLSRLLHQLLERRILVQLQLTVTGLGGSPVEPGIPGPIEVVKTLERILSQGLLAGPECVKLRWDPVARYDLGRGIVLSNAREDLFDEIFRMFHRIGAKVWTSSVLDLKYQGAVGRLKEAGITVEDLEPEWYRPLYASMEEVVLDAGGRFSICCSPSLEPWVSGEGCIDGDWMNGLRRQYFGGEAPVVETIRHNAKRRGGQRPRCGCSYSTDISYSTGFRTCATQYEEGGAGGCCLYCYSWHGRAGRNAVIRTGELLKKLHRDPPEKDAEPIWHRALERNGHRDGKPS